MTLALRRLRAGMRVWGSAGLRRMAAKPDGVEQVAERQEDGGEWRRGVRRCRGKTAKGRRGP